MKFVTIVGARPQFIKAAALSRAIKNVNKEHDESIEEVLVHTGQHFDTNMSSVFFETLDIAPAKYHLNISSLSHGKMTGRMLEHIEDVLLCEKPQGVLVYGDTNSTLAGALAALKLHIPLAHVEAGLRSFDKKMPEEINRVLTDSCADLLFVPCSRALKQLLSEGKEPSQVHDVGDVMYDVLLHYQNKAEEKSFLLEKLSLKKHSYALVTIHRASNTDCPKSLENLCCALIKLSKKLPLVFPLHPRTRKKIPLSLLEGLQEHICVIEPLDYLEMLFLQKHAQLILTDSGGVQKEAYFLQRPCLILREQSEWTELLQEGGHLLVGCDPERIEKGADDLLKEKASWNPHHYGRGDAAEKILKVLLKSW